MAIKFTRKVTKLQKLNDTFVNSFQKTGFINEEIFETKDRDITDAYFGMLSNVYNMGIYNSILIGYKQVEYSEELLQFEELGKLSEREIKRLGSGVFALTHPQMYKMYECIYIETPVTFGKVKDKKKQTYTISQPKKAIEIINTLKLLKELKTEYKILPHVVEFLTNQLKKQSIENLSELKTNTNDLFIRRGKTEDIVKTNMFIPLLKNNMYYEDNGNKRYPYMSECYHYHRTRTNQIKFHVKEIKKRNSGTLVNAYFTTGRPKNHPVEIFVIKQYGINFFNPFTFLEKTVADSLYKRLINNKIVTEETYELIKATYEHYLDGVEEREEEFKNAIPTLEIVESSEKDLRLSDAIDDITELDSSDDIELGEEYTGEVLIEDPIGEAKERSIRQAKGFTTIDDNTIESIILGHNGKRTFGFYDHIIEYYLRVFISSGANKKPLAAKTISLDTKDIPKAFQLVATINQNPDMFTSSGLTHPLDAFMALSYKKYLYFTPKDKAKSTDGVADRERYLDWNEEYGLLDVITTKSENSSGLQSSVLGYKRIADRFKFRK